MIPSGMLRTKPHLRSSKPSSAASVMSSMKSLSKSLSRFASSILRCDHRTWQAKCLLLLAQVAARDHRNRQDLIDQASAASVEPDRIQRLSVRTAEGRGDDWEGSGNDAEKFASWREHIHTGPGTGEIKASVRVYAAAVVAAAGNGGEHALIA